MKDLAKLNREKTAKVKELRGILEAAETRGTALTSEEETRFSSLKTECEARQVEIDREIELQNMEKRAMGEKAATDPAELRNFGEFIRCVAAGGHGLETRDVSMSNGPSMGFLVPDQFDAAIRMIDMPSAIFRPRAMVIPAGTPPDAKYVTNSLDQSGTKGIYGGVSVTWVSEGAEITDGGDPAIKQITFEPHQAGAYIDVTQKQLNNAPATGALLQNLLRGAILGAEEDCFYANGSGVGKPLALVGSSAELTVTRAVASQIAYADVVNMLSKHKMGGSSVFIASQSTLPQLMTLQDGNGNAMWQANLREGVPMTLLGYPLLISDLAPVLGTKGDLALVDLKYYGIKDGSGLSIMINPYENMGKLTTRIYAFWNVDGQPMLTSPLLLRDGVSQVSPFVVLK